MIRGLMPDEEWALFAPFVIESGPRRGRRPVDHRRVLDGEYVDMIAIPRQYDASGLMTQSVDPAGITTAHVYASSGNLCATTPGDLCSTTEGAAAVGGNPALNLTTSFTPDAAGNIVSVVDPRGNAVTTAYDAMRRKTLEETFAGPATGTMILARQFLYDPNGRLTTENRATSFSNNQPVFGQSWTTQYTPTGKVAAEIDPSGFGAFFRYDAMDREGKALDASGRATSKAWDLAGQQLTEVRAKGFDLEETYQAFAWWPDGEKQSVTDANGNITNLAYDGFNRLSAITFADHSTEQSQYDPDGDLTIWTNRGGFGIVRCYDADNRKVSEAGITGASNTGACPSGGTPNLATRAWDIQPRTFGYDLAGRLTAATNSLLNLGWTYDAAGRPLTRTGWSVGYTWDASGNLVQETYPDGSIFCFGYDAADRMTSAAKGACPGTALASLGYDPLGRRGGITFGDGSTESYGYFADDRLQTLAHAFPNDAADNVTLTYGYDDAGRELSRQYSNAAYAWSATAGTTSYAAANSLNQYPTVGGATYSYWPEGPPKAAAGGFNELDYDEQGQLAEAYVNSAGAWWFAQTDALGHRMSHWLQPASNTYTLVQESTDGLRPETVMDWVTPYTSGAPGTTIHRDFVLGPDPDEYLAWVDTDGSIRYPMTDREGTVIAQAQAGKAKQISTYDIYGESAAPISEAGPGGAAFPFRYTGQRLDPWTGFLSYKARDYAPALERFLQPDPAGVDQGPNLYAYVLDDPVDAGDPGGECGGHGGNACGDLDLSGLNTVSADVGRVPGASGLTDSASTGSRQTAQNGANAQASRANSTTAEAAIGRPRAALSIQIAQAEEGEAEAPPPEVGPAGDSPEAEETGREAADPARAAEAKRGAEDLGNIGVGGLRGRLETRL